MLNTVRIIMRFCTHSWYTTKVPATNSVRHGKTIYKNSWYANLTHHQQPINTSPFFRWRGEIFMGQVSCIVGPALGNIPLANLPSGPGPVTSAPAPNLHLWLGCRDAGPISKRKIRPDAITQEAFHPLPDPRKCSF